MLSFLIRTESLNFKTQCMLTAIVLGGTVLLLLLQFLLLLQHNIT
jgi:hypothetical protein